MDHVCWPPLHPCPTQHLPWDPGPWQSQASRMPHRGGEALFCLSALWQEVPLPAVCTGNPCQNPAVPGAQPTAGRTPGGVWASQIYEHQSQPRAPATAHRELLATLC